MRKLLSILLVFTFLLGLVACGNGDADTNTTQSTASTSETVSTDEVVSASTTTTASQVVSGNSSATSTTTRVDKSTSATSKSSSSSGSKTTVSDGVVVTEKYVTVHGSSKNLNTWVYQLDGSGLFVREAKFDSGKGGDAATVIMATDVHFTEINDKDRQENNTALMWTHENRKNEYAKAVANVGTIMDYASQFDQTVFTGDVIDYLSWGNLELVKKHIWEKDANALVALGNHEPVRTLNAVGETPDTSSLESRYEMLKSAWKHDPYYTSKVIKNKVMIIQLDNSQAKFWKEQLPKLKADLDTARKNGYVVLLFYHLALRTGNRSDQKATSFYPATDAANFYNEAVWNVDDPTADMYNLITNSADVIKGAFCGHEHYNYYTEINAKTPDGKAAKIPQYVLASSGGDSLSSGCVMKITVN